MPEIRSDYKNVSSDNCLPNVETQTNIVPNNPSKIGRVDKIDISKIMSCAFQECDGSVIAEVLSVLDRDQARIAQIIRAVEAQMLQLQKQQEMPVKDSSNRILSKI